MARSMSIGNQLHRFDLVVNGARAHSSVLPKETARYAATLEATMKRARELGALQEQAKQHVATLTQQLGTVLQEGGAIAAKVVRLAEVTFGPRDTVLREFRPATEGRATKRAFKRKAVAEPAPAKP